MTRIRTIRLCRLVLSARTAGDVQAVLFRPKSQLQLLDHHSDGHLGRTIPRHQLPDVEPAPSDADSSPARRRRHVRLARQFRLLAAATRRLRHSLRRRCRSPW